MSLSNDFETRSTTELKKAGVHAYVEDPNTDVWCWAYALPGEEPGLWVPGDPVPEVVYYAIEEGLEFRAWNAAFERIIWREIMVKRYGFPPLEDDQWFCTMVEAGALNLPMTLEMAGKALGLEIEKDMAGHRLMMQMARPRRPRKGEDPNGIYWWDDAERRGRLYDYCKQDVRVEQQIAAKLRPLPPQERQVYLLDQRINDRGVYIDLPLVRAAQGLMDRAMDEANDEIAEVTGGAVARVTNHTELRAWLNDQGLELDSVSKDVVRDLLSGDDELDGAVRAALQIRADAGKSSTAKLQAMLDAACADGRARGLLQYHGAGTGRWAGRRIQPQNFPRPTFKPDPFIELVLEGEYELIEMQQPLPVVISNMLRSMLRAAPGQLLRAGDFGQIEARVLAWIAEQDDLLELFASGGKIYEEMGAFIFGIPVEEVGKESFERQVGKNTILGCGFQMGADRFAEQAREQTGIILDRGEKRFRCKRCGQDAVVPGPTLQKEFQCGCRTPDLEIVWIREDVSAKAVNGYRERNDKIKAFWPAINDAAIAAVRDPGSVHCVGRNDGIRYTYRGSFLWCRLPSGRYLAYAKPKLGERRLPEPWDDVKKTALSFLGVDPITKKWRRQWTYGGHLTENVVQAMARDLMASAMLRLDRAGYSPILTVHDEIVCETPKDFGSLEEFLELMKKRPKWAKGLPVKVEGWEGERYRK